MWRGKSVSVVFPTYNERESIREAIEGFFATELVDEIVVVDNNAAPGTGDEVRRTDAVLVHEPRQGYGYAIQQGLGIATGDYLIISEPDGTFSGRDVVKLLAYAEDCDVVFGSRTHREFIWAGANMGWWLKWGNYVAAKIMEFAFNTSTLSDVGCTMRLLTRHALEEIQPYFTVGGSAFGLEMILLSLIRGLRVVQVPLNYTRRVGESSVTGYPGKAAALGLLMLWMIGEYRVRSLLGAHPAGVSGRHPRAPRG